MTKRTRRGVYINLEDSDIFVVHNEKIYKFSSQKKKEIFLKRIDESINAINKLNGKLFKLSGLLSKDYDITNLLDTIYDRVYKNMLYK